MDTHFQSLLQIRLQHDYFPDGNCRDLVLVPSPLTTRLMETMSMRMVEREYGIELYYGEADGRPSPLKDMQEALRLSFWLRPTTPLFYNYTSHLPQPGSPALFYATNFGQGDTTTFPFTSEAATALVTSPFQWEVRNSPEEAWIANESGEQLNGEKVTINTEVAPSTRVNVNTDNLQAGRYFFMDGDEATPFLAGKDGHKDGDVGLLSFYLGNTGNGQHAVISPEGTISPGTCTISLTARSTIWRYYLIARSVELRDFSISGAGDSPEFIAPAEPKQMLADGTKADVLVSAAPIQLRFRPTQRLLLSYTDGSGRKHSDAILLPNAGGEQIRQDKHDSTVFYSELFVYL